MPRVPCGARGWCRRRVPRAWGAWRGCQAVVSVRGCRSAPGGVRGMRSGRWRPGPGTDGPVVAHQGGGWRSLRLPFGSASGGGATGLDQAEALGLAEGCGGARLGGDHHLTSRSQLLAQSVLVCLQPVARLPVDASGKPGDDRLGVLGDDECLTFRELAYLL